MNRRSIPYPGARLALFLVLTWFLGTTITLATATKPPWGVYFSPHGGATQAVVNALNAAKTMVLVQAYSFTSAPIAKALTDAHKRGVRVDVILDKSNCTGPSTRPQTSSPTPGYRPRSMPCTRSRTTR